MSSLLLIVFLAGIATLAHAQSSLQFGDSNGRTVEFTNFGTIIHSTQNLVSRGYEIVYNDGSGPKRAYYLDSTHNSGMIPVSLSADRPNGSILSENAAVYVRAVTRTRDNKLEITSRYIFRDGAPGIEAVITVTNVSNSSVDIGSISIYNPETPSCSCPCVPVKEFDGATVLPPVLITVAPNVRYKKTQAVFTAMPALSRNESRDVPGCEPPTRIPIFPVR